MRGDIAVYPEECKGRAPRGVETEQRAFLPVRRYGKVDQVVVGTFALLAVLETGDVLMRRCKLEDCPAEEENHPAA